MMNFINSRLGFGARLLLISALFLAPIGLLTVVFINNEMTQIQFSTLEIDGADYLTHVWGAVTGGGQTPDAGGRFKETQAAQAFASASGDAAKLDAGVSLIGAIADGSNLTLDPDLDSFYTQDAVTVRLPALYQTSLELQTALAGTDAAAIDRAVDHLNTAAGQAQASLTAAIKDNAEGRTRAALNASTTALAAASDAAKASVSTPATAQAALTTLQARVRDSWTAADTELSRLLKARVAKLTNEMLLNLGMVAVALAAAAALVFAISRALSSRIKRLIWAMEQLAANETAIDIPCASDRNETGRIAASLAVFKAGIVERNALQADAAAVHAANAARLREVEAAFQEAGRAQASVVAALATALTRLAEGDLVFRLSESFAAEYETLRGDFNDAMAKLQETMLVVAANTNSIGVGADEIAQASDDLSRRTEQQAASLEETAAALDEITATVKKTAAGARQASEAVSAAKGDAERSDLVVNEAVQAMGKIEKSSQEISQIIGVIDEIAFQTNLLALNAGVEAARAGDAGRGFAVVAQEVRALAQRSAEAAKEIKALISASSKQVSQGVELVGQTGKTLRSIAGKVSEIDLVVSEISASAQEQATGLNEVNIAVNQMDQVVQQNAAMVEEATAASHSLKGETAELGRLLLRFSLGETAVRAAPSPAPRQAAPPAPARGPKLRVAASHGGGGASEDGWEEF